MVFAGSTYYMSYRADYDDAMGHTSMTLGSRLEESSFPPYSRDRTAIVITVLRLCMADPRCPDLTHASGSFSSVCLSPHSRSSSFQLIRRSLDLTSLRSVPRKRPYLSPFSHVFFLFSSRRRLRLSRSLSFVPHVRDSSSSVLTIPYTGSAALRSCDLTLS